MMCDTNWCTFCDNAINPYSDSLYCSEECLRKDALMHHPMLGYNYSDLQGFLHTTSKPIVEEHYQKSSTPSQSSSLSSSLSSSYSSLYQPKPRKITFSVPFINQAFS